MAVKFLKFLQKCRTSTDEYNFQRIGGGKFQITQFDRFFKLFNRHYPQLGPKNQQPLVFRPRKTGIFYLDIDLRLSSDVKIPNKVFIDMSQEFIYSGFVGWCLGSFPDSANGKLSQRWKILLWVPHDNSHSDRLSRTNETVADRSLG